MKVLLINPNFTIKVESRDDFSFFPPLGLGYLAALLEPKGHEVKIADLNLDFAGDQVRERQISADAIRYGMSESDIKELIQRESPDLIGVSSIFTPFFHDALRICALAKEILPDVPTVIGGAHASMEYQQVILNPEIDFVIRGEGEIPFTTLVERMAAGRDWDDVKGVVWKKDNVMQDNGMGEQVKNLDDLPLPAYHLLDMNFYTSRRDRNFAFSMRFPIGHLITSRGCPYTCVFCSTRNFFPNYRSNSAERVLEEIEFLKEHYGVREIHFHDDAYLIQRKRVEKISNLMIERNTNIKWQISQGVNLNLVNPDLLALMHKSGMYRMGLPIESGSEEILKLIRKHANLDHARNVIAAANRIGIFTHANFIIGFPFEDETEMRKTHEFASTCGVDFLKMLICQPLAGSELFSVYKEEGLLDEIRHSSTYTATDYDTRHFSAEELNRRRQAIIRDYNINRVLRLLNPISFYRSVWPKINTWESFTYFMRVAFILGTERFLRNSSGKLRKVNALLRGESTSSQNPGDGSESRKVA